METAKNQRQLLYFSFFIISKKINCIQDYLSLLEFFFQQVQLYTTALFLAVPKQQFYYD